MSTGKRIVITTFGSLGDVYPYLALALGLKARGHEPLIATSECYRNTIEAFGISFRPVRPDIDPDEVALSPQLLDPKAGPEFLVRKMLLPHLMASYSDLWSATEGADLLITHPITYAGPIIAQKRKLSWVSSILAPLSFFSAFDLPAFPVFPQLVKLRSLGPGVSRLLLKAARLGCHGWSRPIDEFRRELGLKPWKDPIFEGQFSPELNLALFSSVLAKPQPDWPSNSRVTGFSFLEGASDFLDPEIERFLEAGPAPIVFTLGSSAVMAPGNFYRESVKAAKALGKRALLLVGKEPKSELGPLPEGIVSFGYAPHSQVFPRAEAIVHQGGIGTTGEALRSGRPMLVVPFAFDQPDNAFRVTRLGVAKTLYRSKYLAPRVADDLNGLLTEPGYALRADEVSRVVRSENGVETACNAIEERLEG